MANDTIRGLATPPRRRRSVVLSAVAVASAAGLLAACGSSGSSAPAGGSGSGSTGTSGTGSTTALSTRQVNGVGTVLTDQSGKTVYTPDQEASGTIKCTGSCLSVWFPVVSTTAKPAAPAGVSGTVATVKRPDNGQLQVTFDGKPLYTFQLDQGPGDAHGQNAHDSFNGIAFTWRTVPTAGMQSGGSGGSGGY